MKQALYYKTLKDNKVQCVLCPWNCVIPEDKRGNCGVRQNKDGKLYSLVYGKAVSTHVDPIEKKPLFHLQPGSLAYSIGTVGCNLHCKHCQNYSISQATPEELPGTDLPPQQVVDQAIRENCSSIAYTYTEPTIFYEYMLDTAKLAKKKGIKNVIVSNGFINEEPLKELCKHIDGANIDLKCFNNKFYRDITTARLEPVLNTLKILKQKKVWLEITNLIIPTLNEDLSEIKKMCKWIQNNLGNNVPLHFTAFYPTYKLTDISPTPADILTKARNIAKEIGLHYVYIGNTYVEGGENTYCPECNEVVIERVGFSVSENRLKNRKCTCGEKIPGVWQT
jgi:pyruvate formate lyase activating enzyme